MVFSSFICLFGFLPVYFLLYYLTPSRFKNCVALIGSYFFYAWGAPKIVGILFLSSVADYFLAKGFFGAYRKRLYVLSLVFNISLLVYFKYANFFVDQVNGVLQLFGSNPIPWVSIALPAGISFFTFHKLSYLTDVYVGRVGRAKTLINYLLYVAFFPQLIAGPIVRYHDVGFQLEERTHPIEKIFLGMVRFCFGLAKKVLIADEVGKIADNVFKLPTSELTSSYAWLGVLAYAFQIYFDFSGYSDMAIGLARMMGIEFLENFNMPYISQTITEFWRRWHISLSNWMREYLYIPLGGNRVGKARMYANLVIVFLISGLWHGASWTFVVWGVWHGMFLVIDKLGWSKIAARLPKIINVAFTFFLVTLGWVLFRSETFSGAFSYLQCMFNFSTFGEPLANHYRAEIIHNRGEFFFVLAALISFLPASEKLSTWVIRLWETVPQGIQVLCQGVMALLLFCLSVFAISANAFSPFLYFQF